MRGAKAERNCPRDRWSTMWITVCECPGSRASTGKRRGACGLGRGTELRTCPETGLGHDVAVATPAHRAEVPLPAFLGGIKDKTGVQMGVQIASMTMGIYHS